MLKKLRKLAPSSVPEIDLGPPAPRKAVRGSATSIEAAEGKREADTTQERVLFRLFQEAGHDGRTDKENEALTGWSHETCSARRRGLVKKRLVRNSGRMRGTPSGHRAYVWIVGAGIAVKGAPSPRTPIRPDDAHLRAAATVLSKVRSEIGENAWMEPMIIWLQALANDK
jgi:hypothetical protein